MKGKTSVGLLLVISLGFLKSACASGTAGGDAFQWVREKADDSTIESAQRSFIGGLYDETIVRLEQALNEERNKNGRAEALIQSGIASSYIEKYIKDGGRGRRKHLYSALFHFRRARELIPEGDELNICICSGMGYAYLELKRYSRARLYLEKGLSYPLENFKKEKKDMYGSLAGAYAKLKKRGEAVECSAEVIRLLADFFFSEFGGAREGQKTEMDRRISVIAGKQAELAAFCVSAHKTMPEDLRKFSLYRESTGSYEAFARQVNSNRFATGLYTGGRLKEERVDRLFRLGCLALGLTRYEAAAGYFQRALESGPADYQIFPLYLGLTVCHHERADYAGALDFLRKGDGYFKQKRGVPYIFLNLKQYELAREYLITLLKLPEDDPFRAEMSKSEKDYLEKAISLLSAPSLAPYEGAPRNMALFLGRACLQAKLDRVALDCFNYVLEHIAGDPNPRFLYYMLGSYFYKLKEYDRAVSCFDKVLSLPLQLN